ncbi:MAG: fluoride efflux transporter CrcB [Rhodobacteraceae bacterium]|nr:fluoride efflux transporter CrcB [Paracoccaceae bacterium]
MVQTLFLVAAGGAAGSVLRYLTILGAARAFGPGFPWGTLAVNVVGSVAIGALAVILTGTRTGVSPLLMAGFLGGFTTFSTFSLDALRLWQGGQAGLAGAYVAGSVGLSLAGVVMGATLARGWAA